MSQKEPTRLWLAAAVMLAAPGLVFANPPVASYIFPAGARRGDSVEVRVGGLFLHGTCEAEIGGPGITLAGRPVPTAKRWFEGPVLPLPDSQRQEDYPSDMLLGARVAPDAPTGGRRLRLSTAQGVASGPVFMVGDLPEVVENEIEGDPIPQTIPVPGTANGRLFPREDVDLWEFRAEAGKPLTIFAHAAALNSPVLPRIEILDKAGRVVAAQMPYPCAGTDASIRFDAPATGTYRARISDAKMLGSQAHVYRLTATHEPLPLHRAPVGRGPSRGQGATVPATLAGVISAPGHSDAWTVNLAAGQSCRVELEARRLGSPLRAIVTITDPAGKQAVRREAGDKDDPDPIQFKAASTGAHVIRVADKFRDRGGESFGYSLSLKTDEATAAPGIRLAVPSDSLVVPRGGATKVKVSAERIGGFSEAVALEVGGLPPGVSFKPATIARGAASVDLEITASATVPLGVCSPVIRGRAGNLAATAMAPALGCAPETGDIRLAVAFPAPFKIVSEYEMTGAPRGENHRRKYRIDRGGYEGPIHVGMADRQARHLQGVTGPEIVVPPGKDSFEYPALLAPWMEMGRTCRVCVMAWATVADPVDGKSRVVSFGSTEQNQQMIVVVGPGRLELELDRVTVPAKGRQVIRVKVSRDSALKGEAEIEAIVPAHFRGVAVAKVTVPEGAGSVDFPIEFAAGSGPFNAPITIMARVNRKDGPVVAEATVLPVGRIPAPAD
ncbi:MAG: hypothetical protein FJ261_10425 [Planctomycetes bacterium]|nr:hypothetical protein [Planctomycetota bacterium]